MNKQRYERMMKAEVAKAIKDALGQGLIVEIAPGKFRRVEKKKSVILKAKVGDQIRHCIKCQCPSIFTIRGRMFECDGCGHKGRAKDFPLSGIRLA